MEEKLKKLESERIRKSKRACSNVRGKRTEK